MSNSNSSSVLTLSPLHVFSGSSGGTSERVSYTISQALVQLGKLILLLLLILLFSLSLVVWLWVISFRGGWRFWNWAQTRGDTQQVMIGIIYGIIVLFITPFFLFVEWAQKQFDNVLPGWMRLPAHISLRELYKERLGITLGEEFPFFIEEQTEQIEGTSDN